MPDKIRSARLLKPDEFAEYLGIATWLCSMSEEHKNRSFTSLDTHLLPPILLKQFRVVRDQKLPIAFLSWARVSKEVDAKIANAQPLQLKDWGSGTKLVVVECVAPFGHRERIIAEFLDSMKVN